MKKKFTLTKGVVCLVVTLLAMYTGYAQLPDFTVTATPTPQTCTGNGSISFTTSGTNPAASLDYALYLLPNTTTPVVTTTSSPINNLTAGNYLLVANQSLGSESNSSSTNVTIANNAELLEFNLATTLVRCGNDGKITVNVLQGNAVSYEIISGPVTAPLQASNLFQNLPAGLYQVRAHDNCGDALVVTVQLGSQTPLIVLGPSVPVSSQLPTCNSITLGHAFSTSNTTEIFYPVTMVYTVFPPGGGSPQTVTNIVNNGPSGHGTDVGPVGGTIPFYHGQTYTYNLTVTDACGNVYVRNNNTVNYSFDVIVLPGTEGCSEHYFSFQPSMYVPPYTVTFISTPPGFNPSAFNSSFPTHFGDVTYQLPGTSIPEGSYTMQFTDACGRTATKTFETTDPEVTAQVIPNVDGCASEGGLEIGVPGRTIVSIQMIAAPPAYPEPLPQDVSFGITPEAFELSDIPLGTYTFELVDSCGQVHTVVAELEVFGNEPNIQVLQRPGCAPGYGSVRIRDMENVALISVTIVSAPAAYAETLPHNVSANIAGGNGFFYMNNLPAGNYTADIINECGMTVAHSFTVEGYQPQTNNFTITENCGSFNLQMQHSSNGNYVQTFWLQKYDEDTDTWGHPLTGQPYAQNTMPTADNSVLLNNNAVNYTLQYTGTFRVVKVFHVYSNGSAANFRCVSEIYNFEFSGRPVIESAYGFPCANGLTEIAIEATGVDPLTYSITTMNGAEFIVDNGTSNIFSGLASATYNFRVTDACGSFSNIPFDINELDPLEITAINLCEGEDAELSVPVFSFLNYEWYEEDDPTTILSTTSVLSLGAFDSDIHPGTYNVRIFSTTQGSCIDQTLEYVVLPNNIPNAGDDNPLVVVCNEGNQLDLTGYLSEGHDTGGTWTDVNATGALTGNMLNTSGIAAGTYNFTYSVLGDCNLTDDASISIELRDMPTAPVVANVPGICEGGDIQLAADAVPGAVYQWTGPNNFTSDDQNPVLAGVTAAASGNYQLIVTVNGCSSPASQTTVAVNAIPDFTLSGATQICAGQSAGLNVVPQNFDIAAATYQWYHEGVLQPANTANIIVDQTGIYEVIVTNGICVAAPQQIVVTENTNAFDLVLEDGCRDFNYIISVLNNEELPGATYEWTGPDGILAGQAGPEVDITEMTAGMYTVNVTNVDGCVQSASVDVLNTFCRIPRGISPNVDTLNDSFDLSNLNVQHLQIFNRYGMEVYSKDNYVNEWYGQSDKGDLPSGTYYYVVSLSTGTRVTGWVYLQREN